MTLVRLCARRIFAGRAPIPQYVRARHNSVIHRCVRAATVQPLSRSNTLTERAQRRTPTPPTRDCKQNNCMPTETRPPRSIPSPPPRRRRDMPRADRGRQQLLDDLGYVQPIFRAGNSGDCTIIKSVALLLVVIGLVVFVGRFAE